MWPRRLLRLAGGGGGGRSEPRYYAAAAASPVCVHKPSPQVEKILSILCLSPGAIAGDLEPMRKTIPKERVAEVLRHCDAPQWRQALEFFNWAASRPGFTHTMYSVRRMLRLLNYARRPREALALLRKLEAQRLKLDDYMYSLVLAALAVGDQAQEAYQVFEDMIKRGLRPEPKVLNIFIKRLKVDDAVGIFKDHPGLFNQITYNIVIDGLSKQSRMEEALYMLGEMQRLGIPGDVITYTSLVHGFCCLDRLEEAQKVLASMPCSPNSATFNTIIHTLCKAKRFEDAFMLIDDMVDGGCIPTVATFGTIVDGLCKAERLDEACKVVEDMVVTRGCVPDACVFGSLMDGYCKAGRVEEAVELAEVMAKLGIDMDRPMFNTLIDGFCKVNQVDKAFDMLQQMKSRGFEPNRVTYNVILNALCKAGKIDDAAEMFRGMKKQGVPPDVYTYTTMIDGLCKAGRIDDAKMVLQAMVQKGCIPNIRSYNAMVTGLCDHGKPDEAEQLMEDMVRGGSVPDAVTYTIVLTAYCKSGRVDDGIKLFRSMHCQPTSGTYHLLIDGLCLQQRRDEAHQLLQEMLDKGLSPMKATSRSLIESSRLSTLVQSSILVH